MQAELTDDFRAALPSMVRVLQIIVVALAAGCVVFLVVAHQTGLADGADAAGNDQSAFLELFALAFLAVAGIARLIVPRVVVAASLRKIVDQKWQLSPTSGPGDGGQQNLIEQHGDAARLWFVYMTKTIVGVAILEGATFFLIIVYMLGRSSLMATCAIALMVVVAAHFPTVDRVSNWIADRLRRVDEERQMRM